MSGQRCPICDALVPENPRYKQYLCPSCANRACSKDGRPLRFSNLAMSGGFVACYADTGELHPGHECYVDGIWCWADEARFGGIVIETKRPPTSPEAWA